MAWIRIDLYFFEVKNTHTWRLDNPMEFDTSNCTIRSKYNMNNAHAWHAEFQLPKMTALQWNLCSKHQWKTILGTITLESLFLRISCYYRIAFDRPCCTQRPTQPAEFIFKFKTMCIQFASPSTLLSASSSFLPSVLASFLFQLSHLLYHYLRQL